MSAHVLTDHHERQDVSVNLPPEPKRSFWVQRRTRALLHREPNSIVDARGSNLHMMRSDLFEVGTVALDVCFLVVGVHDSKEVPGGSEVRGAKTEVGAGLNSKEPYVPSPNR